MPTGRVRVVRIIAVLALALVGASCADGRSPTGTLGDNQDGRAVGPSGLEQRIVTKVGPAPAGSPYTAILTATSTLVNTGATSAHLTARVCFFKESDVETTATMDRSEPLINCAADSAEGDLAPGASTTLEVTFGVRSGAGTYTLKLRHSLAPAFGAEVSFRIP